MDMKGIFNKLIIAVLVILVLAGAYYLINSLGPGKGGLSPSPTVQISTLTPTPSQGPPKINVISIMVPSCKDCMDPTTIVDYLKQAGVAVENKTYAYDSKDGEELIAKYGIERVPTILFSGDIASIPSLDSLLKERGELVLGQMVLRETLPPYYDVKKSEFVGLVSITAITESKCLTCKYASVPVSSAAIIFPLFASTLRENGGVGIQSDRVLEANSTEAKDLISKYNITRLPVVIISKDIEAYPELALAMENVSSIESDGNYIVRKMNPPYLDLATYKEEGQLTFVYIRAGLSCLPNCYNYRIHERELARYGVVATSTLLYDYDTPVGRNYTQMYNITKVPTILISPEVKLYPGFMGIYDQIGEFEKDGWFVFRNFELLGNQTYFDISLNKTIGTIPGEADLGEEV